MVVGYVAFVLASFLTPFLLLPLAPIVAAIGFPGIGGVVAGAGAGIALALVRLSSPVNPWVCFAIFAVQQFFMLPHLVNAKLQVPFALVTFALIVLIFF